MRVYFSSPNNQLQAEHCADQSVLLSFAIYRDWLNTYQQSFARILIDSGAYSELNSGKQIYLLAYKDWSSQWIGIADAIAGLDNIKGDYKKGFKNYQTIEWSFPTWHDTDPLEILPDLIAIAKERKTWIGIGLLPPRHNKEKKIREALEIIPENIHIHGWALREYAHIRRFDSMDSTHWWRDALSFRQSLPFLTYAECLELVIKKYNRTGRELKKKSEENQSTIFELEEMLNVQN